MNSVAPPDHFPWEQLIPLIPEVLIVIALLGILFWVGPRRVWRALKRTRKIGFAGLEIELADQIEEAARAKKVPMTGDEAILSALRISSAYSSISCSRILWVDDRPMNNAKEMRILRGLCVQIDIAPSTQAARDAMQRGIYDLVISDMGRGENAWAGLEIIDDVKSAPLAPALIYYVGQEAAVPNGAAGLTSKPDKLFELIASSLSKRRGR